MPAILSGSNPSDSRSPTPSWAVYCFGGAVAGLVVGIIALYGIALAYEHALGISLAECAAVGCAITLLLSQPVGIGGMAIGAIVGAVAGTIVYRRRHPGR